MFVENVGKLSSGVLNFFTSTVQYFLEPNFLNNTLDTLETYFPGGIVGVLANILEWLLNHLSTPLLTSSLAELLLYTAIPFIIGISILKWFIGILPLS